MASSLKRLTAECLSLRPLRRRFTTAIASSRPFSTVPHSVEDFSPLDDVFEPIISKADDGMVIRLPLPGFSKEHVKVSVEPNELVIDGSCPVVHKLSKRIEIPKYVSYSKTDINIKAKMNNGLLHVIFPNPNAAEKKKTAPVCSIPVKVE